MYYDYGWRPYVPVAVRRRRAEQQMAKLKKKGRPVSPVVIEGRAIARTFWGKAWCDNLERYSDYANRLPRGRTYVRNGSVVDLQVAPREVKAMVSGSDMYTVAVKVAPVPKARWNSICKDSAGAIDSLVELLQGRFSKGVMERICQQRAGLFPSPDEIKLSCSCPDWASMCKHVAAVLYGIGARLDERPELLFKLREVDEKELIARAGTSLPLTKKAPAAEKVLAGIDLSEIFGLEMATGEDGSVPETTPPPAKPARGRHAAKAVATAADEVPATKSKGRGRRASSSTQRKALKSGGQRNRKRKAKKREAASWLATPPA
jgi:uncharacterized Zn finger protein